MNLFLVTLVLAAYGLLTLLLGLAAGCDLHGPLADVAHWIYMALLVLAIVAMQGVAA